MIEPRKLPPTPFRPDAGNPVWLHAPFVAWLMDVRQVRRCVGAGSLFAVARSLAAASGLPVEFSWEPVPRSEDADLVLVDVHGDAGHLSEFLRSWSLALGDGGILLVHGIASLPEGLVPPGSARCFAFGGGLAAIRLAAGLAGDAFWASADDEFRQIETTFLEAGEAWLAEEKLREAEGELRELRATVRRLETRPPETGVPVSVSQSQRSQAVARALKGSVGSLRLVKRLVGELSFAYAWSAHKSVRRQAKMARRLKRRLAGTEFFNGPWYVARHPEIAKTGLDPLTYFVRFGIDVMHETTPAFDGAWYLKTHTDLQGTTWHPLAHYLMHGEREGRAIQPHKTRSVVREATPVGQSGAHLTGVTIFPVTVGIVAAGIEEEQLRSAVLAAVAGMERLGQAVSGRILVMGLGRPLSPILVADTPAIVVPQRREASATVAHNRLMEQAFGSGAEVYIALSAEARIDSDALVALVRAVRATSRRHLLNGLPLTSAGSPQDVEGKELEVNGSFLAIPRTIYAAIGGFDGRFPVCGADVDYSWRAEQQGFGHLTCPGARFLDQADRQPPVEESLRALFFLTEKWGMESDHHWVAKRMSALGLSLPVIAHDVPRQERRVDRPSMDPQELRRPW